MTRYAKNEQGMIGYGNSGFRKGHRPQFRCMMRFTHTGCGVDSVDCSHGTSKGHGCCIITTLIIGHHSKSWQKKQFQDNRAVAVQPQSVVLSAALGPDSSGPAQSIVCVIWPCVGSQCVQVASIARKSYSLTDHGEFEPSSGPKEVSVPICI